MQVAVFAPFRPRPGGFAEPTGFPVPESPREQACALAGGLTQTLALARALAEAGRRIDLAGLDSQVGLLCARMLDLDPEDGRGARVELIRLRAELDALAAVLSRPPPAA
ncbi:MAG: hypothetical protein KGI51_06275 [Rhodospirillales bacterium]|nr:hypothetical protein [Rhodospirillales bacterium]